jgi:hypothetical protein
MSGRNALTPCACMLWSPVEAARLQDTLFLAVCLLHGLQETLEVCLLFAGAAGSVLAAAALPTNFESLFTCWAHLHEPGAPAAAAWARGCGPTAGSAVVQPLWHMTANRPSS